ncbi:hypothetical protein M3666_11700 [Curtobacterium sp. ODYSSEY 48 V2]|uniref:hypothetical protein n=1 Tax=unclassified Curtobacterium TaxID=257496 RepID=UPI00203F359A|nr:MULTISPECIES: hypothetical protein [unclassified Curtobacterium]MCM3505776.1 hypothetical protein [Curtobacterium sp. ODYSSEY 48 V2]MDT0210904.1 hypothetical protein [Curtobacterium sp. BRD11]
MLDRPDRVPSGRRAHRPRTPGSAGRRFAVLRWTLVGVWTALVVSRIVVVAAAPQTDLAFLGIAELVAISVGVVGLVVAVVRARAIRRRRADEALALAIRRIDPTVWLVPAAPTPELRQDVLRARPEATLGERVTWAFGATEASLWELEERRATRLLVIRWSRMVHVGVEDVPGERDASAVAMHYVRPDDSAAVATFFVRSSPGSRRLLGRGPRLERLVADLARERIVA